MLPSFPGRKFMDGHIGHLWKVDINDSSVTEQQSMVCSTVCVFLWFLSPALISAPCHDFCPMPSPFNYNSSFLFPYTPLKCSIGTLSSIKSLILPQSKETLGILRFSRKNVVNKLDQLLRKPVCFPEVQTQLHDKTHLQWRFWEARELWHPTKGSLEGEEKPFCDEGNCYMLPTYSADDSVICYWTGVSKYFIFLEHISGCAIYFYWKCLAMVLV